MRILYFVERFWPLLGGVEVLSANVLPELRDRGHEITVVTGRDHERLPERERWAGIDVRRLDLLRPLQLRDVEGVAGVQSALRSIALEVRPDLVHVVFTGTAIFYAKRSLAGDAPMILSFHGSWPGIEVDPRSTLAGVLDRAACVTACSQSALADLLAMAPAVAAKSCVVLNGLDPPPGYAAVPLPEGPPVFLASGRVVEDKGFDVAIEALALASERLPGARLVIAGDGPARSALERQAAALGVAERVEFLGWVSPAAMHDLVDRSTAVLVPSRLEGFGLVALEAAHGARPVVASRVGGLPEVVADGETGLLVEAGAAPAFAEAMVALVTDRDRATTMGAAARRRAVREFSGARHADAWDVLYREVGGEVAVAG